MSLGKITKATSGGTVTRKLKGSLSEINVADPLLVADKSLNGIRDFVYSENFIYLLDKAFSDDTVKYLSIEQEHFINRFFKEAEEVTQLLNTLKDDDTTDPYAVMSVSMKQLDKTLGNYIRRI